MPIRAASLFRLTVLAATATLSLAACDRGPDEEELANIDDQLVGNTADPAVTSALEDQILVDPALTQQSNKLAVRPPSRPAQAQYPQGGSRAPATMAADYAETSARGGVACGAKFDYDKAWARRLPAAFAVYPGGRVTEAAGNDRGECRVRVVAFTSGEAPKRLLDWYHARAVRAGYSSEHQMRGQDHILAGANGEDAFYLIVTPVRGGSDVALIANSGG